MLPENHNKKCFIPEIRDESSHESVLSGLTVEQSKAFKVHLADIQQSFIINTEKYSSEGKQQ